MNQPLAIVGASTRAAAASAARAGFQPLAADLFADADLRHIATATRISPYPAGFIDWMRAVEPPAWMYTGALENHPELVDQLAWIAPLWGNAGDVLTRARSPSELSDALAAAGLLFPETRTSPVGLPRDGSWLVKTYAGASGSGVQLWNDERGARIAESVACYQKRIEGVPCAAVFLASDERAKLLGVTRQLIGESWLNSHGFQYSGSIGPWPLSEAARASIERQGNILAKHFELIGLFGVDFILDGDSVCTLEVNPRYTASVEIVERFTGANAIREHALACGAALDQESPPTPKRIQAVCGKAVLFARQNVVISARFAKKTLELALEEPWPSLADVSITGTQIEAGRPILTFFAEGSGIEQVERELHRRVVDLENEIYAPS